MATDGSRSGKGDTGGRSRSGSVRRRSFLKATGAGAAGIAFAGCVTNPPSDGSDGGDGGSGTTTGSATPSLPNTIRIGCLAPAPSDNAIGASLARGAELAVQQLNQNGGIAGSDVELVVKDTEESPGPGRTAYQELTVGDDPVDMTCGVFTSEVLMNIMDDIAEQETVHITAGAATPEASAMVHEDYDRYKYHFRSGPVNAHHLGLSMIDFAKDKLPDLGWESVAVLVEDYEWTVPVSEELNLHLDGAGLDVAMNERYASGTENFGPLYDRVEESGADAAYIAMAHTGNPAIVQWAKQQRPFAFGGIHVPMQLPQYFDLVQGACAFGVTQNVATPKSAVTENTIPFTEAFFAEYETHPVYTGYISYDAVMQYAEVVENAESIEADDVIHGMETDSYVGTAATIEYYPPSHEFAHDVVYDKGRAFPLYTQWQVDEEGNGTQEVLWPEDLATANYQKPPWV